MRLMFVLAVITLATMQLAVNVVYVAMRLAREVHVTDMTWVMIGWGAATVIGLIAVTVYEFRVRRPHLRQHEDHENRR